MKILYLFSFFISFLYVKDTFVPRDDTKLLQSLLDRGGVVKLTKKKYIVTSPLYISRNNTKLLGNNALIQFEYSQKNKSSSFDESLLVVDGRNDVEIRDIRLEYLGQFDLGTYEGTISGIYVKGSNNFKAVNVEAFNFNRAGINLGGGKVEYNHSPMLERCYLHHNRIAGCIYGNNENGVIQNNRFTYNGRVGDNGTGYGLTGWSASLPKNTIVKSNVASYNVRKGIDFHSGVGGIIDSNTCENNFACGIFVHNVTGSWLIRSNKITNMNFLNEHTSPSIFGIEIGNRDRNGNRKENIKFTVERNSIIRFSGKEGKVSIPIMIHVNNLGRGEIIIRNNLVDVGYINNFILASNAGNRDFCEYYDVSIIGNTFRADRVKSLPVYLRGEKNRNIIFADNIFSVTELKDKRYFLFNDKPSRSDAQIKFLGNEFSVKKQDASSRIEYMPRRNNQKISIMNNSIKR